MGRKGKERKAEKKKRKKKGEKGESGIGIKQQASSHLILILIFVQRLNKVSSPSPSPLCHHKKCHTYMEVEVT